MSADIEVNGDLTRFLIIYVYHDVISDNQDNNYMQFLIFNFIIFRHFCKFGQMGHNQVSMTAPTRTETPTTWAIVFYYISTSYTRICSSSTQIKDSETNKQLSITKWQRNQKSSLATPLTPGKSSSKRVPTTRNWYTLFSLAFLAVDLHQKIL